MELPKKSYFNFALGKLARNNEKKVNGDLYVVFNRDFYSDGRSFSGFYLGGFNEVVSYLGSSLAEQDLNNSDFLKLFPYANISADEDSYKIMDLKEDELEKIVDQANLGSDWEELVLGDKPSLDSDYFF